MEETLGKRIVVNRKRLGLTQDQLAERLGVTAQAVSKWENDQSCPDITMLPRLAQLFGVTIDALLGCEPPRQESVFEAELIPDQEEGGGENEGIHLQKGNWEFRWDSGRKGALGPALLVLLVGGLLLAGALLNWDIDFWDILWPSGLLVFGLIGLVPRFPLARVCSVVIGAYYLASELGFLTEDMGGDLVFPVILLVLGLSLLTGAIRKPKNGHCSIHHNGNNIGRHKSECHTEGETFSAQLSFGENHFNVPLPRLAGGEANVSFGELCVDLSACEEVAEDCRIDASCAFGELEFLVPRRCRVEAATSTSFASFEIKGTPAPEPAAVIFMDASVSFGEITIRYI